MPDVIACQNDMMAAGARQAVTALVADPGRVQCLFTGVDGLREG